MRRFSKSDHNLAVKTSYEKIKISSSSGIFKTIYPNGSYLFLFEKK